MTSVRYSAAALSELLAEFAYYDAREPGLGDRFAAAVEETIARAAAFPLVGSRTRANMRRMLVRGFPFAVVYRHDGPEIVIVAVAHHARYPSYWRSRVQDRWLYALVSRQASQGVVYTSPPSC